MTLKEQAQQLIASCEERDPGAWRLVLKHGPDLAQAYLDKCEEVERLREALDWVLDQTVELDCMSNPDTIESIVRMRMGSGCLAALEQEEG